MRLFFFRPSCGRHSIELHAIQRRHPLDSPRGKQLRIRLGAVNDVDIIQDTRLDDPHPVDAAERVAMSEQRRPAVAAEVACKD